MSHGSLVFGVWIMASNIISNETMSGDVDASLDTLKDLVPYRAEKPTLHFAKGSNSSR
jgi:hypothetical protein